MSNHQLEIETKALGLMSAETSKAWENPQEMAATILQGVNDQSTQDQVDKINSADNLLKDDPVETQIEHGKDFQMASEVVGALTRESRARPLATTLRSQPDNVVPTVAVTDPTPTVEGFESTMEDIGTSEASEISSMHHQVRELSGVVKSLSRDMANTLSSIESRLSLLESKVLPLVRVTKDHKRVISASGPVDLQLVPSRPIGARTDMDTIKAGVQTEALRDTCSKVKFNPSALVQAQLLKKLANVNDLGDLKLPLTRTQWRPDELSQIVSRVMKP